MVLIGDLPPPLPLSFSFFLNLSVMRTDGNHPWRMIGGQKLCCRGYRLPGNSITASFYLIFSRVYSLLSCSNLSAFHPLFPFLLISVMSSLLFFLALFIFIFSSTHHLLIFLLSCFFLMPFVTHLLLHLSLLFHHRLLFVTLTTLLMNPGWWLITISSLAVWRSH